MKETLQNSSNLEIFDDKFPLYNYQEFLYF